MNKIMCIAGENVPILSMQTIHAEYEECKHTVLELSTPCLSCSSFIFSLEISKLCVCMCVCIGALVLNFKWFTITVKCRVFPLFSPLPCSLKRENMQGRKKGQEVVSSRLGRCDDYFAGIYIHFKQGVLFLEELVEQPFILLPLTTG